MGDSREASASPDEPEPSQPALSIDLIDRGPLLDQALCRWLVSRAGAVAEHLQASGPSPLAGGELRIELVDDAAMTAAHAQWKNDPTTTDVLTFDLRTSEDEPLDTDLMVCVDEARRQAEARGIALEHEVLLYIIHGLLHCLGHDDQHADDALAMHAREDELLAAVGVGHVFAQPEIERAEHDG